jgi:hypothetical protein
MFGILYTYNMAHLSESKAIIACFVTVDGIVVFGFNAMKVMVLQMMDVLY